jgi:hypothetical protein
MGTLYAPARESPAGRRGALASGRKTAHERFGAEGFRQELRVFGQAGRIEVRSAVAAHQGDGERGLQGGDLPGQFDPIRTLAQQDVGHEHVDLGGASKFERRGCGCDRQEVEVQAPGHAAGMGASCEVRDGEGQCGRDGSTRGNGRAP